MGSPSIQKRVQVPLTNFLLCSVMGSPTVAVICYFNGKLIDEDRNGLLKLSPDEMEFKIKCRYRVDDYTAVAIDVDDDQPLKFILDQSHHSNGIIAYIDLKQTPVETNTMCQSDAVDILEPSQKAKLRKRVGHPNNEAKYKRGVGHPSNEAEYKRGVGRSCKKDKCIRPIRRQNKETMSKRGRPYEGAGHCAKCRGSVHNKQTCTSGSDNSGCEQSVKNVTSDF
ncbi:hypothetical protein AQUCO_04300036v1 [Aquilegia coerulea]|uniref:Uncharacterized protein n=1 Tax=Aquilegia coerulea TaxID=218851 RepID=A0A2G5CPR9_AQUCA|nr:hypothetical protein AQUCO_04300036v1 [Aquilegia coerulea]